MSHNEVRSQTLEGWFFFVSFSSCLSLTLVMVFLSFMLGEEKMGQMMSVSRAKKD